MREPYPAPGVIAADGRYRQATSAPSAATTEATSDAVDIAWMKASWAARATLSLTWIAAPSDSRAAAGASAGTPAA